VLDGLERWFFGASDLAQYGFCLLRVAGSFLTVFALWKLVARA
jgi:hypothetical protein